MKFGEYFKKLRKDKDCTQEQIARMIGKSTMLISGVETEKNGPFLDKDLEIISNGLSLSESERKELFWAAAKARNKLPPHVSEYVMRHKDAILILEMMEKNNMNEASLKRVVKFMEEIGNAENG